MRDVMPVPERTLRRCPICGSSEVCTDEVVDGGWVLLAECARCDRRWTASAEPGASPRVARVGAARRRSREVASAA